MLFCLCIIIYTIYWIVPFEYYFEQYYKSIEKAKNQKEIDPFLACANLSVSFSEYMKNVHPKNFADTYESYKNKIFSESTTSNNN